MNLKILLPSCLLLCFAALIAGCNLGPGEGGTATIVGKVKAMEYNSSGLFIKEYYAANERVFIIYGDEAYQSDEVRTSYDGSYRFEFLRKGDYTLFVYSDCPACDGEMKAVFVDVSITKNGREVTAPEMIIEKH